MLLAPDTTLQEPAVQARRPVKCNKIKPPQYHSIILKLMVNKNVHIRLRRTDRPSARQCGTWVKTFRCDFLVANAHISDRGLIPVRNFSLTHWPKRIKDLNRALKRVPQVDIQQLNRQKDLPVPVWPWGKSVWSGHSVFEEPAATKKHRPDLQEQIRVLIYSTGGTASTGQRQTYHGQESQEPWDQAVAWEWLPAHIA